jgi:hypothetical protein
LELVLARGWRITIVPSKPEGTCRDLAWVVNPPFRAHGPLQIDVTYGWTAEDEVATSPREFQFVTNCAHYQAEYERVSIALGSIAATPQKYEEAVAKLGSSPTATGRFWITDSRIQAGKIEWMKFSVEIRLTPGIRR